MDAQEITLSVSSFWPRYLRASPDGVFSRGVWIGKARDVTILINGKAHEAVLYADESECLAIVGERIPVMPFVEWRLIQGQDIKIVLPEEPGEGSP